MSFASCQSYYITLISGQAPGNLHPAQIKFADSRDADIIQAIGKDPDIKMKELVNISVLKYPKMNSNIISKRIQIHSHLIEFKGAPKAEGYYLKNKINHTHHIHMHLIKGS